MLPTDAAKLAHMARQIADFFRPYPAEEAEAGIRDHLDQFWTPAMRDALRRAGPEVGLDALVAAALEHRPQASSPIRKELAGPGTLGPLASDAG